MSRAGTLAFNLVQVLLCKYKGSHDGALGHIFMMLRLVRLLRIIRLARVIENIPPVYMLVMGIAEASKAWPRSWGLPSWCSTLPRSWG